jgi:hypothetical protein
MRKPKSNAILLGLKPASDASLLMDPEFCAQRVGTLQNLDGRGFEYPGLKAVRDAKRAAGW